MKESSIMQRRSRKNKKLDSNCFSSSSRCAADPKRDGEIWP